MSAGNVTAGRDNGRRRPRGYAAWAPRDPTQRVLAQVEEVLDEYRDQLPLTVRQIFYRLVGAYGFEKTEAAYERLGGYLNRARRAGIIPFEQIRDDGAVSYSSAWHASVEDFWDETARRARRYRRDRQAGQRQYLELWTEAAGMAPQLARVAGKYSVPVFSAGGFVSLSTVRLAADRALRRNVPTVLLHVGDHDPSGTSIYDALVADASAFVEADRTIHVQRLEAHRVALTREQVEHYDLATSRAKSTDSRSARWNGGETCQLEALPPDVLAGIVRSAVEERLDLDRYAQEQRAEELDRHDLLRALPAPASEEPS